MAHLIRFSNDAGSYSAPRDKSPFYGIHGKRWYYKLKGETGLLQCKEVQDHSIIVAYSPPHKTGEAKTSASKYMFACFTDPHSVDEYIHGFAEQYRHFHEVIDLDRPHKLHYDLDIAPCESESFSQKILDLLIFQLKKFLSAYISDRPTEVKINVYSSHDFPTKGSYHVVVDNYWIKGKGTSKHIFDSIVGSHSLLRRYVDVGTTSRIHNLRLLDCTKVGTRRLKILNKQNDEVDTSVPTFTASLVTWIGYCSALPLSVQEVKRPVNEKISDTAVLNAYDLVPYKECFQISEVEGCIVALKRLSPSECPTCLRVHEQENPFLIIKDGQVEWCCRRTTKRTKLVGEVSDDVFEKDDIANEGKLVLCINGKPVEKLLCTSKDKSNEEKVKEVKSERQQEVSQNKESMSPIESLRRLGGSLTPRFERSKQVLCEVDLSDITLNS